MSMIKIIYDFINRNTHQRELIDSNARHRNDHILYKLANICLKVLTIARKVISKIYLKNGKKHGKTYLVELSILTLPKKA